MEPSLHTHGGQRAIKVDMKRRKPALRPEVIQQSESPVMHGDGRAIPHRMDGEHQHIITGLKAIGSLGECLVNVDRQHARGSIPLLPHQRVEPLSG